MMGASASESAYRVLMGVLESRTGQTLSPSRIWRIEMSLKPVMQRHGIADLDALVAALVTSSSRQLLDDTVDAMLNNETYFYREYSVFDDIAVKVLEQLREINKLKRRLTIWHCGVSTGQEAYSLAMAFAHDTERWGDWRVRITATDVSAAVVERARSGIYSQFEIQRGLPVGMMMRWFDQSGESWVAKPELRRRVAFAEHNLLGVNPPQAPFDIVLCRNVMLYFSADVRRSAFDRLASAMREDGMLMLGASETVIGQTDRFRANSDYPGLYFRAPLAAQRNAA